MPYYWTTDPNWFQVVLAGCTVVINLAGVAVVGIYTRETVKLRRGADKTLGMSIAPELDIRTDPVWSRIIRKKV